MKAFVGMLLVGAVVGLVVWGCEADSDHKIVEPPPDVSSIQIVLGDDTLHYLPGDTAATTVSVVARDRHGVVMQGVKISASLSNPALGYLEYLDSERRDTTNELGRVEMMFHGYAEGVSVVTVTAGGSVASAPIVVVPGQAISCQVDHGPTELHVWPGHPDSTWIRITILDPDRNGIPNVNIVMSASVGRFTPFTETDSSGRAEAWWILDPGEYGHFCMSFMPCGRPDSVCVNVGP